MDGGQGHRRGDREVPQPRPEPARDDGDHQVEGPEVGDQPGVADPGVGQERREGPHGEQPEDHGHLRREDRVMSTADTLTVADDVIVVRGGESIGWEVQLVDAEGDPLALDDAVVRIRVGGDLREVGDTQHLMPSCEAPQRASDRVGAPTARPDSLTIPEAPPANQRAW